MEFLDGGTGKVREGKEEVVEEMRGLAGGKWDVGERRMKGIIM